MTGQDYNAVEAMGRIMSLEHQIGALRGEVADTSIAAQGAVAAVNGAAYASQNYIRNGNFDLDRNRYIYDTDTALGAVPADVSQEAAHWYSHPADVSVESIGSMVAGSAALSIANGLFTAADVGKRIIVNGAGASGAPLSTTIATYVTNDQATTTAVAGTTATNVRVRWRMIARLEDSTDIDADSNAATNVTLKTPTHSRYATTVSNPDYDRVNGFVRISSQSNTLDAPLPHNYLTASKQYILSFIYKLAGVVAGSQSYPVGVYAGFWDNTLSRLQFMEGLEPALTVDAIGTTGSTAREYFIVMYNSAGDTLGSARTTIVTSNAVLDSTNYNRLAWAQPAGTVRSEIFRRTGTVYERLLFPYPASTYFDRGQVSNTVTVFPATTRTRPISLVKSTAASFAPPRSDRWQLAQLIINVPSSYAVPTGADKQWLVIGLQSDIAGASSDHALLIDLVCLDDKSGSFTRSPLDFLAKRQLSAAPVSGSQGTVGSGGATGDPTGSGTCPVFDAIIDTDHGPMRAIDLVDQESQYRIIDRNGNPAKYIATINPPQTVYSVTAAHGTATGSASHPFFTDEADVLGTPMRLLQPGDRVLTRNGMTEILFTLKHIRLRHTVRFTIPGQEKGFWHDGFGVHNNVKLGGDVFVP